MLKFFRLSSITTFIISIPFITSAAGTTKDLKYIIGIITDYFNQAVYLLIGLAIIIFIWQVIQYYIKPNGDRTNAGLYVMYSVIGFFAILSVWGLVNIVRSTFSLDNSSPTENQFKELFPAGSSVDNCPGGAGSGPGCQ